MPLALLVYKWRLSCCQLLVVGYIGYSEDFFWLILSFNDPQTQRLDSLLHNDFLHLCLWTVSELLAVSCSFNLYFSSIWTGMSGKCLII